MTAVTYPAHTLVPHDIMVDLETLGTTPGSAILSIGAVAFDPRTDRIGHNLHVVVNIKSCRALGLREEPGTLKWWGDRAPEARALLQLVETSGEPLPAALDQLDAFIRAHGGAPSVRVWGNGADFDNALLADIYRRLGRDLPWAFWNNRCFRTLKGLHAGFEPAREGVHHNALDDAMHQAKWALAIFRSMRATARSAAAHEGAA